MSGQPNEHFWSHIDQLVQESTVIIDRPRGSPHPRYPDVIYPLDYGYLKGTTAGDGEGIDVWIGQQSGDGNYKITAILITVDLFKRDSEVKILLNCNADDMNTIEKFFADNHMGCFLVTRVDE